MSAPPSVSSPATAALSDAEYQRLGHALLAQVENTVDAWLDADVIDIDTHRSGSLLELHFPGGSKIIINLQAPLHEVWLAAKGGGFHYRWQDGQWRDTRDGSEFLAVLSVHATAQAGKTLKFVAPD
jgi:CyaY protein